MANKCSYDFFELDWDTEYFEVTSAKAVLKSQVGEDEKNRIMSNLELFDFVTILNMDNIPSNNLWLGKETNAFLVDMNIQFIKTLNNTPDYLDDKSKIYDSYSGNEKILDIAKKTFVFSRFFNDPYLPADKAKNIYVQWTKNAFNNSQKFFAIAERQGNIVGYLLFSMDLEISTATIELIAVDQQFIGQYIGKSLENRFESFVFQKGIRLVKVGTQVDNVSASNFYSACGFQYASCNSVYHYWPRK